MDGMDSLECHTQFDDAVDKSCCCWSCSYDLIPIELCISSRCFPLLMPFCVCCAATQHDRHRISAMWKAATSSLIVPLWGEIEEADVAQLLKTHGMVGLEIKQGRPLDTMFSASRQATSDNRKTQWCRAAVGSSVSSSSNSSSSSLLVLWQHPDHCLAQLPCVRNQNSWAREIPERKDELRTVSRESMLEWFAQALSIGCFTQCIASNDLC